MAFLFFSIGMRAFVLTRKDSRVLPFLKNTPIPFLLIIFGIIMGTNVAPILAYLYLAMPEQELEAISKMKK